jgi:hypothetical protein
MVDLLELKMELLNLPRDLNIYSRLVYFIVIAFGCMGVGVYNILTLPLD